jgi:hypothetical protein
MPFCTPLDASDNTRPREGVENLGIFRRRWRPPAVAQSFCESPPYSLDDPTSRQTRHASAGALVRRRLRPCTLLALAGLALLAGHRSGKMVRSTPGRFFAPRAGTGRNGGRGRAHHSGGGTDTPFLGTDDRRDPFKTLRADSAWLDNVAAGGESELAEADPHSQAIWETSPEGRKAIGLANSRLRQIVQPRNVHQAGWED